MAPVRRRPNRTCLCTDIPKPKVPYAQFIAKFRRDQEAPPQPPQSNTSAAGNAPRCVASALWQGMREELRRQMTPARSGSPTRPLHDQNSRLTYVCLVARILQAIGARDVVAFGGCLMSDVLLGLYAHRAELQRLISDIDGCLADNDNLAAEDRDERLFALQHRMRSIDMQIDAYLRSGTVWARAQ